MPTVCFISYEIHPTTPGGCGVLIRHAADRIVNAGGSVVFLLDLGRDLFDQFIREQIPLFADPSKVSAFHVNDLIPSDLQEPQPQFDIFRLKSRRFAAAVETLVTRKSIDIIEVFEYCGPGYDLSVKNLFREAGRPTLPAVTRIHGSIEILERYGGGLVRDRSRMCQLACERAGLRLSSALLTPSQAYFDRYYAPLYGLESDRAHVSTPPKRGIGTVEPNRSNQDFSIVCVGRLFHLKGVDTLVFAAAQLMREFPDSRFFVDIIGYDSTETPFPDAGPTYGDYLKSVIPPDLYHRFRFRGQIPQDEILSSLKAARFAVFPNRIESFCYALHEVYDAGVPVIINDLPAFRDFFEDGKNCLTFDGSATHLIEKMRRLVQDDALVRDISRPYSVAEEGFTDWYFSKHAESLGSDADVQDALRTLVIVLADDGGARESCNATTSLREAATVGCDVFYATRCNPKFPGTFWILGESRVFTDQHGHPVDPVSIQTVDTLLVLHQNDRFDPDWISLCRRALARRDSLAFTGTWMTVEGVLRESRLDILPELEAFENPGGLHRVLLRTARGVHLPDLFDPTLGPLGHLGLIWKSVAEHGHGVLSAEGGMHVSDPSPLKSNQTHLKSLVLRYAAPFAENIAIYASTLEAPSGVVRLEVQSSPARQAPQTWDRFEAAESLGGRTLIHMAWKKLLKRVRDFF